MPDEDDVLCWLAIGDLPITNEHVQKCLDPRRLVDAHRIEAWPERGIFGTRLGPHRTGRKW